MIDWARESFLYGIPWWLWTTPLAAAAIGIFVVVNRTLGFRNALMAVGAFLTAALAALSYSRGRQAGWQDRASKEERDAKALVDKVNRARTRARERNSDPERLRDDDGFKRKS